MSEKTRLLLPEAAALAEKIAEYLRQFDCVRQVQVAGSIRRRLEVVEQIEVVIATANKKQVKEAAQAMPGVAAVSCQTEDRLRLMLAIGMPLTLYLGEPENFPILLQRYTGDGLHNDLLAAIARERGWDYATAAFGERAHSEQAVYKRLGLPYIEPEMREGTDEVLLAQTGRLPQLVEESDIQGGLHIHTAYSDGRSSIAELAAAAKACGWRYLGISDHSRSAHYAGGLSVERIKRQQQEICRLNGRLENFMLLSGIECDILPDGTLDYPDTILAKFDFVVASVHSAFRQSRETMTKRICSALRNKYVTMLGHPTGRILLRRPGYAIDLAAVLQEAAHTGTIIEINANPRRLDLDWRWCREARRLGIRFAINPDAHDVSELAHMKSGVLAARKAGLSKDDIINTGDTESVRTALLCKRQHAAIQ